MSLRIPTHVEVGQRVQDVRIAAGLSGRQLSALVANGDPALIYRVEQGMVKTLDLERLMRIANAVAGRGALREASAEDVLAYLEGRVDELEVRLAAARYMSYSVKKSAA